MKHMKLIWYYYEAVKQARFLRFAWWWKQNSWFSGLLWCVGSCLDTIILADHAASIFRNTQILQTWWKLHNVQELTLLRVNWVRLISCSENTTKPDIWKAGERTAKGPAGECIDGVTKRDSCFRNFLGVRRSLLPLPSCTQNSSLVTYEVFA
jgi:hypothetical protein